MVLVVRTLMSVCVQELDLPVGSMRLVLERFHNDLRLLTTPSKTLKAEGFFKSNNVGQKKMALSAKPQR